MLFVIVLKRMTFLWWIYIFFDGWLYVSIILYILWFSNVRWLKRQSCGVFDRYKYRASTLREIIFDVLISLWISKHFWDFEMITSTLSREKDNIWCLVLLYKYQRVGIFKIKKHVQSKVLNLKICHSFETN